MQKIFLFIFSLFYALISNGQVCFDAPNSENSPTANASRTLLSLDFNNDGNIDIANLDIYSNTVSITLGLGTGKFAIPANYTVSPGTTKDMTAGDFNNDGNIDLAVLSGSSTADNISILQGSSSGVFSNTVNYSTLSPLRYLTCGDFNGDGNIDLATTYLSQVAVRNGAGNGTFNAAVSYTVGAGISGVVISADFNSDGKDDLAVSSVNLNFFYVLLATNTGAFSSATQYVLNSPTAIACNDFNSDGHKDLSVVTGLNTISVIMGNGLGAFSTAVDYTVGLSSSGITSADFNGDNIPDLAVTNNTSNNVAVLFASNSGTFSLAGHYSVGTGPGKIVSADFNNDGRNDMITSNANSTLSLLFGAGNGVFTGIPTFNVLGSAQDILSEDFNNDGKLDLVVCSSFGVATMFGSGTGTFDPPIISYQSNLAKMTANDFNGDGNMDLLVGKSGNDVSILFGNSTGVFSAVTNYSVGPNPYYVTSSDFNADGIPDIACANSGSASFSILLGLGNGLFNASVSYSVGAQPSSIATGDFNGDGSPDLAISTTSGTYIQLGLGNGTFTTTLNANTAGSNSLSFGDFNNDGLVDLLSEALFGFISLGNGQGSFATQFSTLNLPASTGLLPIDFNNDGNMDVAGINNSQIFLAINSGASTFNSVISYPALSDGRSITSGDFNNDGKVDLAMAGFDNLFDVAIFINKGLPYLTGPISYSVCDGSSVILNELGALSYTWSTGATTPTIVVAPTTNTVYIVSGSNSNGCSGAAQTISVNINYTCQDVWPGDANSDGIADNLDVLELGLHFTKTGSTRASISNAWQSYFSNNWIGSITNGKNVNHSDCNGDGTINNNDTLAIYNNYGLTHAFKQIEQPATNPQLSIVPDQTMVAKGTWGTSSVFLGDVTTPISNINGLALTVNFDQSLVEPNSFYVEYLTSFINAANQNLKFNKPDFTNGKVYTATTHTNNVNVSGNGKVAILHYKIKSTLTTDAVLNIGLAQAKQSNASGILTPLTTGSATVAAIGASVGIDELVSGNTLAVFPNPANTFVTIQSTNALQKIELLSVTGQIILSEAAAGKQCQLDLSSVVNGVYFITVTSEDHQINRKKIVVQH